MRFLENPRDRLVFDHGEIAWRATRPAAMGMPSVRLAWIHDLAAMDAVCASHIESSAGGSYVVPHWSSESISRETCSFRSASPNA